MQLCFYVPSQQFLDPGTGADTQRRYAELFRGLADTVNPGFGQVGYYYQPSATTLEKMANRKKVGREHRDPVFTVGRGRQTLRDYSWITIVAQELADRLGGAEGLTETAAFAEVRQLAAGGGVAAGHARLPGLDRAGRAAGVPGARAGAARG